MGQLRYSRAVYIVMYFMQFGMISIDGIYPEQSKKLKRTSWR